MLVLVFRHVPFEDLGLIARSLENAGLEYRYADLYRGAAAPSAAQADAFIFMGGPQSANDGLDFIEREIELIRSAAEAGKPVLGVCLGSQMIAKALGARVYRNPVKEIGWYPVSWTAACAGDALFHGFHEPELLFHWHGETFDLPPGGELLASSEACRNQAFRVGSNIYGLQFHLEVTPEMIAGWCQEDANSADVRELTEPLDPYANAARLAGLSDRVFGRWAGLVTRRS
jgi:GMP synthase-like glutamine amidotransferase